MAQLRDGRSRFDSLDIRDFYREGRSRAWNHQAHIDDRDGQHIGHLIYTSAATLSTDTGSPFYPTFGGRVIGFRANVKTAPTSTFQVNVLLDGNTMFNGDYIEIASGSTYGYKKPPNDKIYLYPDKKLEVDIQTVAAAVGPLVLDIELIPG